MSVRFNGHIELNADGSSEIRNAFIEKLAVAPAFDAGQVGRIYFNTVDAQYYFNNGVAWGTLGSAEIDETAMNIDYNVYEFATES